MITAIDTNILLDVLIPDAQYGAASKALLDEANRQGALIINEAVYAELATQFAGQGELDDFLRETGIRLEASSPDALYLAGELWRHYNQQRKGESLKCPECGATVNKRQHILSDFLIGAHASTHADALATRDRSYYRTYFKQIKILAPRS